MKATLLVCVLTGVASAANFAVVAGANPAGVAADSHGNVYVAGQTSSPDLPVTSGALQSKLSGSTDAFIAKFSPDGTLVWCTYFGGRASDAANAITVDSADNILVAGETQSTDMQVLHAFQNALQGNLNGFILKLDPQGRILYSSYLGGSGAIRALALAVDQAGGAYVTGTTTSHDFPGQPPGTLGLTFVAKFDAAGAFVYSYLYARNVQRPSGIAVDRAGSAYIVGLPESSESTVPSLRLAFVIKLAADGSHLLYESFFGGSQNNYEAGIAVDSTGAAYIAGTTDSVDFPLVHSLMPSLGARPLWKSTDGGNTWTPVDDLPFAYLRALVPDPVAPGTLYAATSDLGIFKSVNNAAGWARISRGITTAEMHALAVNPTNTAVMYAGGGNGAGNTAGDGWIYQTTNGGVDWHLADSLSFPVTQLALDPIAPSIVYALTSLPGVKTTDGGATWSPLPAPNNQAASIAVDPDTEGTVYAYSTFGTIGPFPGGTSPALVYRSRDGTATWQQLKNVPPAAPGLVVDSSTRPATIYAGTGARSSDGGETWTPLTAPFGSNPVTAMAVDPRTGTVYAAAAGKGLAVSTDKGQTWTAIGWPYPSLPIASITPTASALYATVQNNQTSPFVVKLSPDGSTILFSTLLRGHPAAAVVSNNACGPAVDLACWEPTLFTSQNYASGIALDSAGNVLVTGATRSSDFPTVCPAQAANAGGLDAFISVIAPDGTLKYSSYVGGSRNDGASAVTVDPQGNVIVAGLTSSTDFLSGVVPQGGVGFIARVLGPPTITSVLNGASYQPGIEAGSWVMIKGSNLANTSRTWTSAETAGGKLPTSLDGVSVTINGKPAFVYYISSTQINVQAPSDAAVGPVDVVVSNNGAVSPPATAQLQAVAPAFFVYPGTSYTIASRLPDYALAGDPSAVPGVVAVKPGDYVVLWGTGFGATNPAVGAGAAVTGTPAVTTLPLVTVGGLQATVASALLTAGSAGLYQVTIQIPANVPAGAVAVQASVGGASTQSGAMLFVVKP